MAFEAEDRAKVRKGAVITLFGRLSGIAHGIFLFVAKFLYGDEQFGIFALAFSLVELLSRFIVGGFADAITYFASRHAVGQRERQMYEALAVCILWPLGISLVIALALHAGVHVAYQSLWAQDYGPDLVSVLLLMAWGLPLTVLVRLPVEAVRAQMDMKWATIVDICLPLAMFGLAVGLSFVEMGAEGLAAAWLGAHVVCVVVAIYGYTRYYGLGRTVAGLRGGGATREILTFAFPQSVNMAFNYGLVRVDALMLSAWYGPEIVGVYVLVSELVRSIRAAKLAFVGVFAPLVAKYKELENRAGVQESLDHITRFIATVSVPLVLGTLLFYPEASTFAPGSTWEHSRAFPWLLAVGPVLSCYFGLAGNLLLMSGHSRLLLLNSSVAIVVNVGLNALWIPEHGMFGAAAATMTSGIVLTVLQMVEMSRYEKIRFSPSNYVKPTIGLVIVSGLGVWLTSEAGNGWVYGFGVVAGLAIKVGLGLAALGAFAGVLLAWPGHNPEREWLLRVLATGRMRQP